MLNITLMYELIYISNVQCNMTIDLDVAYAGVCHCQDVPTQIQEENTALLVFINML